MAEATSETTRAFISEYRHLSKEEWIGAGVDAAPTGHDAAPMGDDDVSMRLPETQWMEAWDGIEPTKYGSADPSPFRFRFRAISHNINCQQGRGNASCDAPCSIS